MLADGSTDTVAGMLLTDPETFEPRYRLMSVTGERYCFVLYSRHIYGCHEPSPSDSYLGFFWEGGE